MQYSHTYIFLNIAVIIEDKIICNDSNIVQSKRIRNVETYFAQLEHVIEK